MSSSWQESGGRELKLFICTAFYKTMKKNEFYQVQLNCTGRSLVPRIDIITLFPRS